MAIATPFPFLSLPLELREQIYSIYFKPADRLRTSRDLEAQGLFGGIYKFEFDLLRVNRQIYEESNKVWRRENVFVKVATPWPSAVNHISAEGLVPIVCTSPAADVFTSHTAVVQISAPFHQAVPEHTAVLLLDDLHLFAQTWYYSALSYPMLNDRLSTTFILSDPSHPPNPSLQRRLLMPFEKVKGLYSMHLEGYLPSIQQELEARMKIPIPTLESCLESSTTLMEAGDSVLATNPQEALTHYTNAFHAIHILIYARTRTRRVLADAFFHALVPTGRYAGQTGMTVRVILRLKLVARYVAANLHLKAYGDAAFWGMLSIRILRDTLDTEFEHFLTEVVGGRDVGFIYLRTGIALAKMEADPWAWEKELMAYELEGEGSERLFGMARKYMKVGANADVRRELDAFGVASEVVELFGDRETDAGSVVVNADDDGGVYQTL